MTRTTGNAHFTFPHRGRSENANLHHVGSISPAIGGGIGETTGNLIFEGGMLGHSVMGCNSYPTMHRFGTDSSNPANYSTCTPLNRNLHFTNPTTSPREDEVEAGDLTEVYISREFTEIGVSSDTGLGAHPAHFENVTVWSPESQSTQAIYTDFTPSLSNNTPTDRVNSPNIINQQFRSISGDQSQYAASGYPRYRELQPKKCGNGVPPDAADEEASFNGKGRKRNLSPASRAVVLRVRIMGACGRCHKGHGKCGEDRPCKPCLSKNKRVLDLPCMDVLPENRHVHFFTDDMYGHLNIKEGKLINPYPEKRLYAGPKGSMFMLRLHQHFDTPELLIPVVRFVPEAKDDLSKIVFPISSDGQTYVVQPDEILSPPLVPAIDGSNLVSYAMEFRSAVRLWLIQADRDEKNEWHKVFFREEYGKPWPRAVLKDVCEFYHQVTRGGCKPLKSALQSTVLVYMIGHSFYVPEDDIKDVLDRTELSERYTGGFLWVSPLYVNRFIKVLLFQVYKAVVKTSLKHYQDLCSRGKHTEFDRDRIFAMSIVLLILAGSVQSKAIEKAVARRSRSGVEDRSNFYDQIKEIEEYIIDLVLQVWQYKFSTKGKIKANDEPRDRWLCYQAKRFDLMGRFKVSYGRHVAQLKYLSTSLPTEDQLNERTFGATNIDRILKKFYCCIFESTEEGLVPTPTSNPNESNMFEFRVEKASHLMSE